MEHWIEARRRYRYEAISREKTDGPRHLLLALHGYGQLAKYFIRKFDEFTTGFRVVCPEGPHRFYLQGSSGRVGASWMTKEAREMDIEDNLRWLQTLYAQQIKENAPEKVTLLGFSQGAATAARWYQRNPEGFDQLLLWAGVFPPDIDTGTFPKGKPLHFVLGNEDEFYQGEEAEAIKQHYATMGFEVHTYPGKHDLDTDVLRRILG
jgi:predicted esterase